MARPSSSFSVSPACASARRSRRAAWSRSYACIGCAELEHHVVRDVDDRADRAQARTTQALLHPERRLRVRTNAANDAADELRAARAAFEPHRKRCRRSSAATGVDRGRMQRFTLRAAATSRATPATLMQSPRFGVRFTSKIVSSSPSAATSASPGLQLRRQIEQAAGVLARARARAPSTTCRTIRRRAASPA